MRRIGILIISVIICISLLPLSLFAQDLPVSGKCGENLFWTLSDDWTLTIYGTGEMYSYIPHQDDECPWATRAQSIKNLVIEEGVTSIGNCAFHLCSITEAILPSTVKNIGFQAFGYCDSLQTVVLPEGLTQIPAETFAGCTSLSQINIPDSVSYIGKKAFAGCKSIKSIVINGPVTKIDNGAFGLCYNMETLILPDSLEEIGEEAFYECGALKEIELPSSLKKIQKYAFHDCRSLEKINIPQNVTTVSSNAFTHCIALRELVYEAEDAAFGEIGPFNSANSKALEVVFTDSVKVIPSNLFNHSYIVSAVIGKNVETIGDSAFADCSALKSVVFYGNKPNCGNKIFDSTSCLIKYPVDNETWQDVSSFGTKNSLRWTPHSNGTALNAAVISKPNRLQYLKKEELDPAGLKIGVGYSDGITEYRWIEDVDSTDYNFNIAGSRTVTHYTDGLSVSYQVDVLDYTTQYVSDDRVPQLYPQENGIIDETFTYSSPGADYLAVVISPGTSLGYEDVLTISNGDGSVSKSFIYTDYHEFGKEINFPGDQLVITFRSDNFTHYENTKRGFAISYIVEKRLIGQDGDPAEDDTLSDGFTIGDPDGSGSVDADDLTLLSRHIAKIETIQNTFALKAADVDRSGNVDADDLTRLSRFVARIVDSFDD